MNKSFKGQIADQEQIQIRLGTNNGLQGYKIVKFQAFPAGSTSGFVYESFLQLFTVKRTGTTPVPADGTPNFNDPTLLGAVYYTGDIGGAANPEDVIVVFDNMVFNQDIFLTHSNSDSNKAINFYIELEPIKLDLNEATVATLKDMRARE